MYTEREKEVLSKIKPWKDYIERKEEERKGSPLERAAQGARPPFPGCGRCIRG